MAEQRDSPAVTAKKQQEAQRQLVLDYKAVFGGSKGRHVLDDLHHRFGFHKWPAEDTEDERKIARRVFMQGPLYYIQRQLETTFQNHPGTREPIQPAP